jgi:hypothetical protein
MNTNILITITQSINDWINILDSYVTINDKFGLLIFGSIWLELSNQIDNIKILYTNYKKNNNIITQIDFIELIFTSLINISKTITYVNESDENKSLTVDLFKNINKYENNIKKLLTLENVERLINESSSETLPFTQIVGIDHGEIVSKLHIKFLANKKNKNKTLSECTNSLLECTNSLLDLYKKRSLGIYDNSYNINDNIPNILKINYLIKPFKNIKTNKNYLTLLLSNKYVEYNIFPLIDKKQSVKYGPISTKEMGININTINRLNTIKIYNNNNISINKAITSIIGELTIFTGSLYKNISPVYYNQSDNQSDYQSDNQSDYQSDIWYPLKGVNPIVYKYNEIMESVICKNMIINMDKYINYSVTKESDDIRNVIKNNTNISETINKLCFSKIDNMNIINKAIKKEAYLHQFFNTMSIIDSVKKGNYNDIHITPNKYSFRYFNLI